MLFFWAPPMLGAAQDQKVLQQEIENKRRQVQALGAREKQVVSDLETAGRKLASAKKRGKDLKKQIRSIEKKISLAKTRLEQVKRGVAKTEKYAAKRLVGYYKLTQTGIAPVILGADSFFDASVRQAALKRIIESDKKIWEKLLADKANLRELANLLETGKNSKNRLDLKLQKEIKGQAKEQSKKKLLLARVTQEKSLANAALAAMKQAALELEKTINSIKARPTPALTMAVNPPSAFASLKGKLKMPVAGGKIHAKFGSHKDPKFDATRFRAGIEIKAEAGEPFHAVSAGKVVYAGWFKGYGNMIIIDHGQSYFSISAYAEDLFREQGNMVEAGEIIGTVGDTGSFSGPGLYFELRHHSKPLDPANWLRKENQ